MVSRRRSREFLLQSLYSRTELRSEFSRETFITSYFDESGVDYLELPYVDTMETSILAHEAELIAIVSLLAPKFDLATIPVMHILIIMIALTEMLYERGFEIPDAVSLNEAIELAKRFSDDQGRMFINGALSTFLKKRDTLDTKTVKNDFHIFS